MEIAVLLTVMTVLIFVRVPVAYAIGISAVTVTLMSGSSVASVVQRSVASLDSFALIGIPLFIFAAEILATSGLTTVLMNGILGWVGGLRGGLAFANIGSSVAFSGMTGSALADAAGVGKILIPQMVRRGYSPQYAAALTASSSMFTPILPPSIPFIVYGMVAQLSIGALFFAGIVPGIMMALGVLVVAFIISRVRPRLENGRFDGRVALIATAKALPILGLPLLVIGGLRFGLFTPTEAAAICVFYALICAAIFAAATKGTVKISPTMLYKAAVRTGLLTANILIVLAFAAHVGWLMSVLGVPTAIAEYLTSITDNPIVLLLIIVVFLLIVGLAMEPLAAILLVVPVLAPAAVHLGIDPLHLGVIVVVTLMLGQLTPPVAMLLVVTASVAKVDSMRVAHANWAFFGMLILVLLLIVFIPATATWLPTLL